MNIFMLCVVLLSLSSHAFGLAHSLSRITQRNRLQPSNPLSPANKTEDEVSNLTALRWPPCPYYVNIPNRKGNQYILFTKNDHRDHGARARILALSVCTQMIEWLKQLPQGSLIDKRHWEHKSYGDSHVAEEFTVFLDLNPPDVHTDHHSGYLDREQAYFAFQEFRELIALYGAMVGRFELHALGFKRAECAMHIFPWPMDGKADTRRITS